MDKFDIVVIGGGVIGVSIAYHLARFGCRRVLLLERGQMGGGTTAQSSCILRTHYTVPENVALAKAAIAIFNDFPAYLEDPEAESGYIRCGFMLVAGEGSRAAALREALAVERRLGLDAREIAADDARRIHPLVQFGDIAAIGWEPEAGYADAYLTLSAFARAVRLHMLSRVTSYALLLIILTAAVAVVGRGSLAADADASGHLLTYLLLCLALFVASLLVSTGYVRTVVMIEVAALMLDVTMSHLPTSLASLTSAAVHVGSAGVLTAMMLVFGWVRLGRVVSYR